MLVEMNDAFIRMCTHSCPSRRECSPATSFLRSSFVALGSLHDQEHEHFAKLRRFHFISEFHFNIKFLHRKQRNLGIAIAAKNTRFNQPDYKYKFLQI